MALKINSKNCHPNSNYMFSFLCVLNVKTMIKFYNLVFMIRTILLHDYFIYLIKGLLK